MFRSKTDVDRHVKDIFLHLKNEEEKNLRCYNIAKLYYQVGDYESAKRYVSNYLEVREGSAGAHKLLGQTLEALEQKESALEQYKTSLELDARQDTLVLKVCELLADVDITLDVNSVRYWVERADKLFPHNPIVFHLKEKMLTLEGPNDNSENLEALIASELSVRPTDVHLRIKLLEHYIAKQKLEDAYNHAAGVEAMHSHRNSVVWYQLLSKLLTECKESKQFDCTFWILYISVLERYAALCLKEQGNEVTRTILEATQAVFNFDQRLTEFESKNFSNNDDNTCTFLKNMFSHMWGQLNFHLACLFLRKTKQEQGSWSEAGRLCSPLLLSALHVTPVDPAATWATHLKDRLKNQLRLWYREGSYRCSQAGHVLMDYRRNNSNKLMVKIDKFCTSSWRERVYRRIFVRQQHQKYIKTSHFANSTATNPPLRLSSYNELKRYDEVSEEVWPDSLHHQMWIGMKPMSQNSTQNKENEPHPNQTSHIFPELQFSVYNLNQAAPDSLSRLDIDAFLNAAIFCASAVIEEEQINRFLNPEKLPTLPADLTNTLCTSAQEKWWTAVYKMYSKQEAIQDDIGEIRQELQRGLEVIRCIGNHGLHPVLIVHLARIFHHRMKVLKEKDKEHSDILALQARCELYWSNAVPLLERLQNNQSIRVMSSKLFNYQEKGMNNAELTNALEEGKLLLAQRLLRDKQYEQAIDALQALKCPEASFQQGQIYKTLADEIVSSMPRESLTSELRSQHIIMLSKSKNCLYLTLDRLRSPGINPKHPLNSELCTHIADIENELKRIDPDLSQGRNECDDMSDDSYSSAHSIGDQQIGNVQLPTSTVLGTSVNMLSTPQRNSHRHPKQSSTPCRPQHQDLLDLSRNRTEARPSPERLDAQIRQMIHSRDNIMQTIMEQNKTVMEQNKTVMEWNKAILESNKAIMEKLDVMTKDIIELRKHTQRQRAQSVNVNPNLEEDLYVFGDEEYNELNYNANQSAPASSISGNMFASSHRHPYSPLVYPSATAFQGYYQGGIPFSDPNAQPIPSLYPPNVYPMPVLYPNTRSKMPDNILQQGLFTPRLPTQLTDLVPPSNQPVQIPHQKADTPKSEATVKDVTANKAPPVNVNNSSDNLSPATPLAQPVLNTIQYRLGSTSASVAGDQVNVPHCYQISMPSQANIPTTVNLPPLATTLTTTHANMSSSEAPKTNNINMYSTGSLNSSADVCETEHDPIPDFVPVIPLPAEVKVTTGEEDEVTLYEARAKLFRFVDKEWKERGVGNVKLLKNAEGKVRLLMRRDQVLKICANHLLRPDMELTAMPNNEKAWIWVANDFADEEVKLEKLCIRFKTVDEARSFKEHFDKARTSLVQSSEKSHKAANKISAKVEVSESIKDHSTSTGQGTFSPKPGILEKSIDVGGTSENILPDKSKNTSTTAVVGGFSFTSKPIIQKVTSTDSSKIGQKSEETPKISPFAGFTFNKGATANETTVSMGQKNATAGTAVTFGKAATPTQSEPLSQGFSSQPSATSNTNLNDAASTLRRPHAPAPGYTIRSIGIQGSDEDLAQTRDEEILIKAKANLKCFNNHTARWENKGTGQLMILRDSKSGKVRLLMIDDSTLKPCYSSIVLAKTLFDFNDTTAITWEVQYGTDNKPSKCRATFESRDNLMTFYFTAIENQRTMGNDCVPETNKPLEGSWECKDCYVRNDDLDARCWACGTLCPSSTATIVPNQTPLSQMFKAPVGSWECSACYTRNDASSTKCIACESPQVSTVSSGSASAPATTTNQVPLSQMFKAPAGSWECSACYTRNDASRTKCLACESPHVSTTSSGSASGPATTTNQVPLSQMFKAPVGSWECGACYTRNDASCAKCVACESPHVSATSSGSASAPTSTTNQIPLSQMFKTASGSWECKSCYIVNTFSNNYCVACDNPKDPSMPPKPKTNSFQIGGGTPSSGATPTFSFGIPQEATKEAAGVFTFSLPTSNNKSSNDDKFVSSGISESSVKSDASGTKFVFGSQQRPSTPPNKNSPFTFGSPGKSFGFNFVAKSPAKSPGGGDNSEEEVVENDDIHFSPVIPLPDKIEVKTGEEDEEVLYSHRAKLFRYDSSVKEWKERGLGDIKLLRHTQTGKLRLIMRRDQILKLCLNHFLLSDLEFQRKDEKTWLWNAGDYSEGEIEYIHFACRFKTSDIAESFKNAIDEARKGVPPSIAEKSTPESAKGSSTQEIEVLYEMTVTPEEKAAALKLQLPENFYAYKQKPDCTGCRGCRKPSVPLFQNASSDKTSVSKMQSSAERNKFVSSSASPIQFPSKITPDLSTSSVTSSFQTGFSGTNTTQFTATPLSTTSGFDTSAMSFGSSDSNTLEKRTTFSFGIPQPQFNTNESQKPTATDKQSNLLVENLKICSPATTQGQEITSDAPSASPATPTVSIFSGAKSDKSFSLNTGKNIFGGTSKEGTSDVLKPSTFNVNTNSPGSIFLNSFGSESKTPASGASIFGTPTNTSIFGGTASKTSSENNSAISSPFGVPGKPTNTVFGSTTAPSFSFNMSFNPGNTNASPFETSKTTTSSIFETKVADNSQKDGGVSFLPTTDITFSTLAAKAPQQEAFKIADPNFSFAGAGTSVFGSKANVNNMQKKKDTVVIEKKKEDNEEGECDENENDQEHDPQFEPVIPLPDVVEVRTGEEEEKKMFCERAKLYRYNSAAREWKERGVGEMKLLYHAEHGTYRLLLRREQVYKVVCNFLLTPDIEFRELSTSDRTWIWAGMNHAEDEPCVEELAVKFKSVDLAKKFKESIDLAQQSLNQIRKE